MSWIDGLGAAALADLGEFDRRIVADELAFQAMRIADLESLTRLAALSLAAPPLVAASCPVDVKRVADSIAGRLIEHLGERNGARQRPLQASADADTSAFYLARATLSLRTLETEAAELRIVLAAVEREAVRRWRETQPGEAKP